MRWINYFFVELRQGFTQGTDQSVRRQRRPVMQGDGLKLTGQRLLTERLSLRINNPHRIPAFNMWVHAGGRVKEHSHFSYSMWQSTVECVFVWSSHISDLLCKIPCDLRSTHRVWKAPRAALHTLGCARLLPKVGAGETRGRRSWKAESVSPAEEKVNTDHRGGSRSPLWQPWFCQVVARFLWKENALLHPGSFWQWISIRWRHHSATY